MRARAARGLSRPRYRASATADVNAVERAGEMHHPPSKRLVTDPYARHFVQSPVFRLLAASGPVARFSLRTFDRFYGGNHAQVTLRTGAHAEQVARALADGIDQIVILGAGYDSTAFRIDLGDATLFDVDTAPTQEAKQAAIARAGLTPTGTVVYVDCDFESQRPATRLPERGFDPSRRSLCVWLGVMYYLTEAAATETLAELAQLMAPGSRLLADYMDPAVIDGTTPHPGARRSSRSVRRRGEALRFGLTPEGAERLLREQGFAVTDNLRVGDLAARYGPPDGVWCRLDDWFGTLVAERVAQA